MGNKIEGSTFHQLVEQFCTSPEFAQFSNTGAHPQTINIAGVSFTPDRLLHTEVKPQDLSPFLRKMLQLEGSTPRVMMIGAQWFPAFEFSFEPEGQPAFNQGEIKEGYCPPTIRENVRMPGMATMCIISCNENTGVILPDRLTPAHRYNLVGGSLSRIANIQPQELFSSHQALNALGTQTAELLIRHAQEQQRLQAALPQRP